MKTGRGSRTAVIVCTARAAAHEVPVVPGFSDPTALHLLPEEEKARVLRFRDEARAGGKGARHKIFDRRTKVMAVRTLGIDEAVRTARSPQVVILGAGLDGRAWRMPELRDTVVFEVDHPDSQREKRSRVDALTQAAREVRFVPVDFQRHDLDDALAAAGHDPTVPTTWIWEGVVMYLTRADIEKTLSVVARRSAPASRLIVAYFTRALLLVIVGPLVRLLGEPLRSIFTMGEMRSLLAAHGFELVRDQNIPEIGAGISEDLARDTRFMRHLRIITADRPPAPSRGG